MDAAVDSGQCEQALRGTYCKLNSNSSRLFSACLVANSAPLVSGNRFSDQQSDKHQKPGETNSRSNIQCFSNLPDENEVQFQQLHNNPKTQIHTSKKQSNQKTVIRIIKYMIVEKKK